MNTFQIECFLTVARTLNFAKAADILGVTQPAVTHQVNALETELGTRLFNRTTRKVELTESGKIFFPDAHKILSISKTAVDRFQKNRVEDIQVLNIASLSFSHLTLLIPALTEMRKIDPTFHPRLTPLPNGIIYRFLSEDQIDLIVGFKDEYAKKEPAAYKELTKYSVSCYMKEDSPLADREFMTFKDLEDQPLIINDQGSTPFYMSSIYQKLTRKRNIQDTYLADTIEAAVIMVMSGYGIAVLPDCLVETHTRLVKVPLKDAGKLSFGLYYKTTNKKPVLRQFISVLEELNRDHQIFPPTEEEPSDKKA